MQKTCVAISARLKTTYSTDTEHRTIDTYAKAVDVVRTGERSAFDGTSFNGRGAVSTGEAVAGTYYEDFVWRGDRFVRVNVVFFQDDSELARRTGRDRPAVGRHRLGAPEALWAEAPG